MAAASFIGDSPASRVLRHLQRHGEATVRDLEQVLGVGATAVREHIVQLQTRGMVATKLVRSGPGRPKLMYFLTHAAQAQSPKAYDTLISMLLRELVLHHGPEQLDLLLEGVGTRLAAEFNGQVSGKDLRERLDGLRDALEARSIPVAVAPSGQGFEVFSCPYLDVAQEHEAVCRMERHMMETVLGEPLLLEGSIRQGQRSCHFVVAPGAKQ